MDECERTAKSRRCYHRVMSGIERGGRLRFLTLTSSSESPDTCQRSWRVLYMRLKRRHLIEGYIKVPELSRHGKQHLHVLFRGSFISQEYLSQQWAEIHHAPVVWINKTRAKGNSRGLASYMAKYMAKENIFRYSWNWGWVWRGFCQHWKILKRRVTWAYGGMDKEIFGILLHIWRGILHGHNWPDWELWALENPPGV